MLQTHSDETRKGLTFSEWFALVDSALDSEYGLVSDDLPDCDYWQHWSDGTSPEKMADYAIENAGGY